MFDEIESYITIYWFAFFHNLTFGDVKIQDARMNFKSLLLWFKGQGRFSSTGDVSH